MKYLAAIAVILSLAAVSARAEEACVSSDSETIQKCLDEACSKGGALDQSSCVASIVQAKEKVMSALIEAAIADYTSMWGKEAVTEGQERIRLAQQHWEKYREADCLFGYYDRAPSHPPSGDLKISLCKLYKTMARIEEIKSFENYNQTYK